MNVLTQSPVPSLLMLISTGSGIFAGSPMTATSLACHSPEASGLTSQSFDVSAEAVHGYRVMAAIGLPTGLLLLMMAGGKISGLEILVPFVSALAGWQLPSFLIRKRGSARLDEIERQLPELIDLLIATIEAGMGFAASLNLIAGRMQGPLGD